MRGKQNIFLLSLLVFFFFSLQSIRGEQLTIKWDKTLYKNNGIETYFKISGNISYDTIDAIRNGITARLYISVQLIKTGGAFGLGKNVIEEKVEAFIFSYDVWDNSFIIQDRNRVKDYHINSPLQLINQINQVSNPIFFEIPSIDSSEVLMFRGKIRIQTVKLYPPFGIFLFFFDPWNYESSWVYSKDFTIKTLR